MKRPQSIDPEVALVLRLTIFVLLVFGSTSWQLSVFLRTVCGAMLVFPSGATSRLGWLAILAMETYANASLWYRIDNHKYLINYWTLACCLYVANDELDKRWLCVTAKRLVGLCFLFALAWKLIGGEYLDGTFFEHTLITDARFADVATRFGGLSDAQLEENHRLIGLLKLLPSGTSIPLNSSVTTHQLSGDDVGLDFVYRRHHGSPLVASGSDAFFSRPRCYAGRFHRLDLLLSTRAWICGHLMRPRSCDRPAESPPATFLGNARIRDAIREHSLVAIL